MKFVLSFFLLSAASICAANNEWHTEWEHDDSFDAFHFETPVLKGTFIAHDKRELGKGYGRHGLRDMSFKGHDLNAPEGEVGAKRRHQGLLNLYRVYSATETFGSLRDDEAKIETMETGARLTWAASEERPAEISATWILSGPSQIDLVITATPTRDITNFEILPATYLPVEYEKFAYLRNDAAPAPTLFRPTGVEEDDLLYPFFPMTEADRTAQKQTGRVHSSWKWPTRVAKETTSLPIIFGGDEKVQLIQFANPESVSAVCLTPKPESGVPEEWNSVEKHSALYFSLFGRDVSAGETVTAQIRLLVIDTPQSHEAAHQKLYQSFLDEIDP